MSFQDAMSPKVVQ